MVLGTELLIGVIVNDDADEGEIVVTRELTGILSESLKISTAKSPLSL